MTLPLAWNINHFHEFFLDLIPPTVHIAHGIAIINRDFPHFFQQKKMNVNSLKIK